MSDRIDHYQAALTVLDRADDWFIPDDDADAATFGIAGRAADLAEAQVHATLHLAQVTQKEIAQVDPLSAFEVTVSKRIGSADIASEVRCTNCQVTYHLNPDITGPHTLAGLVQAARRHECRD